ncbi:rhamnogalacturonan acetylesterase [Granulicella mallensis]|uniref:Lysophospholipase L1-like esterase n=1 Tax=Granulicella mallensis TaxID=940614 RepID=A0A7W8E806_9BACT|nr:rhamnogalacturonan acetylesterase [Granulicella mallensis]MBB5061984.1 lysophospholipase L1-like esterase [Granulicella mallensis]
MNRALALRRLVLPAVLAFGFGSLAPAQQSVPATPDAPPQTNLPTDAALNPKLPTVFIVGDSTARNGANLGWGDHVGPLFDTSRINVANRAVAGRSSRTYINEGRWIKVLSEMKPGDFLLLQMGHNDGGDLGGAKPRGTLKGIGDETKDVPQTTGPLAGQVETVHTYGWYMRKMIDEAKAKSVQPMILTLTIRNIWKDGHVERDMGYTTFIRQIADQEHIPVIDMATLEADRLEALGQEKTALLFPIDHTHTSPEGAEKNAQSVADALRASHVSLVGYLKP